MKWRHRSLREGWDRKWLTIRIFALDGETYMLYQGMRLGALVSGGEIGFAQNGMTNEVVELGKILIDGAFLPNNCLEFAQSPQTVG